MTLLLWAGQPGDRPMLTTLLAGRHEQDHARFRLFSYKAYSHPSARALLRAAGIAHTIPERRDQIAQRKVKGSRGGRPPAFARNNYQHSKPSNVVSTGSNTGAV